MLRGRLGIKTQSFNTSIVFTYGLWIVLETVFGLRINVDFFLGGGFPRKLVQNAGGHRHFGRFFQQQHFTYFIVSSWQV